MSILKETALSVAMRLSEVAPRLNGVSSPIFGVAWTPPVSRVASARRVIA